MGRPWAKVYAELCARFDSRAVAGRHVVHDHLLRWVRRHDDPVPRWHSRHDLVVDRHGILRRPRWFGRSRAKLRAEALGWAGGRVCALTHRGFWWFSRTGVGPCDASHRCSRAHHFLGGVAYHELRFTELGPMTRGDLRPLDRLPEEVPALLAVDSPWRARQP